MRRKSNLLKKPVDGIIKVLGESDLRNNVIVLFALFYAVYFGFYIGLPIVLNVSYVLASAWITLLGFTGAMIVLKTIMMVFIELKLLAGWSQSKIREVLQPSEWKVQSAR